MNHASKNGIFVKEDYVRPSAHFKIEEFHEETFGRTSILRIAAALSGYDFIPHVSLILLSKKAFSGSVGEIPGRSTMRRLFINILLGNRPGAAFLYLSEVGALEWFLPELAAGKGLAQNRYHRYDIFEHNVYTCDAVTEKDLALRLAGLFHDTGKVDTRCVRENGESTFYNHELFSTRHADRIMKRFGFPPELTKRVKFLVRNHMFHYTTQWTDRAVRRFIKKAAPEDLEDLIRLRLADRTGSGKRQELPRAIQDLMRHIKDVQEKEAEMKVRDLSINGHMLIKMGMKPGPTMGNILKKLLDRVKSGELENDEETLLEEARLLMSSKYTKSSGR